MKPVPAALFRANLHLKRGFEKADLKALNYGVDLVRKTMAGVPEDQDDHARCLAALANALRLRYERTSHPEDLEEAISAGLAADQALPERDDARAGLLVNLGSALLNRFERDSDPKDLSGGIGAYERALAAPGIDPRVRVAVLANLANALRDRFTLARDPVDLDEAVSLGSRA